MDEVLSQYIWVGQMIEVMYIMKAACAQNKEWCDCQMCPFEQYCEILQDANMNIPSEWVIEDD